MNARVATAGRTTPGLIYWMRRVQFIYLALVVLSGLYLAVGQFFLGRRKAGYSHFTDTISELGETGAPDQRLVALGLFVPIGLCLLVVAGGMYGISQAAAGLALCLGVGYVVGGLFPCDPGSPAWGGSARQAVHNLGGGVEYVGGGFCLMELARVYGPVFQWLGYLSLGAALALTLLPAGNPRGLVQRVAEAGLFLGLAWVVGVGG